MKSEHSFPHKRRLFSQNRWLFLSLLLAFLALASCSGGGIGGTGVAQVSAGGLQNINAQAAAALASSLQQLPTDTMAALATATTALGTSGQNALATAANTLSATEFQNVATLTASLNQSTISGLASAMTVEAFGSSQGGVAPTTAFNNSLITTDIQAVVDALNADLGTVPLMARDSLTQVQKDLYDYIIGLRANAETNAALKNAFNGAYNALDDAKGNGDAVSALTNLVNSTSGSTSDLSAVSNLLNQMTESSSMFKAMQDLFKTTDSTEVTAIQNIFKSTIVQGKVDAATLTSVVNAVTETGTGMAQEIAQKQADALRALLTAQYPGYTVTVTVTDLGNGIYTIIAHITTPHTGVGLITALGGIVVNGVTFDTTGAAVTLSGMNGHVSELQVGMVVKIEGTITIDANGTTGKANAIVFDPNVLGPITGIDLTTSTLTVMGQTVLVDGQTVFAGLADNAQGLAGLTVNDLVEVSGLANANGNIKATRITRRISTGQPTVSGRVSSLTAGAFKINGLDVNWSSAQLSNFGPEGIQTGDFVEVRGNLTSPTTILASSIEKQSPNFKSGLIRIDGFIDSLFYTGQSVSGFSIITPAGLQRVALSASTQFFGGRLDALQQGARVNVEGRIWNNVIQATKVTF